MATILRFDEPLRFEPFTYRGLDKYAVFIHEEGPSYDYFGFTRIPEELTAGKNLLAFTGTDNLQIGSEIAIEVMDANGNLIPVQTADYIGDGLERVFSIEIDERVPQGDAVITVLAVAKGKVQYNANSNRDNSQPIPTRYFGRFNIRWQKRLQCNPAKKNSSDIIYFENPDIVVEEVMRPYHTLHYSSALTESYSTIAPNTASLYTLCSTGSAGTVNTSASIRYEEQADKYYIFCESSPDFGGFTDDMIGGTIFFPEPVSPYPSSVFGPYASPVYNQLEDGDGQGDLDTGSQEYSMQGAYNTYIIERLSPLQMRVNSPHTTFQGHGRQNQKEMHHKSFDFSEFRLDFAQNPVSWSNDLASGSNEFLTSYAKITFDKLTPLAGDVTRIKTYIRNDQTANEFQLQADVPVVSQEMLIQSQSDVTRHPAGDFSKFGVSSSLDGTQGRVYWTSSAIGVQPNPDLTAFRAETDALLNPIVDSLMVGTTPVAMNLSSSANHWLVDATIPMLMQKDQYYQVEFKSYGVNVSNPKNLGNPKLSVYIFGSAMNDSTFGIGKLVGEISDIENNQLLVEEDPLDNNKSKAVKFTFQADATEYGYLRFKIDNGLWYIAEISVKPYYQFGYTPHHFECFIATPKANVREMDALDFRFEFYNANHHKAAYVSEIHNIEFENRFTLVATNAYIMSASIDNFFHTTPIGDNDWSKQGFPAATMVVDMPEMTESIYHSGSVGIGNFISSTINYPLHLRKDSHEGNTTIKVESYSSSILHLAANQGSTYPNSRSAYIMFDHANSLTSSVIGYTEIEDQDPGGATMSGSTKGSFTIHERTGRVMSLGVGGTSRFHLVTGKSEGFRNEGSHGTFIGHQNPKPGTFDYELDVSGSIAVRSGTIFLPDIITDANPPMLLGVDSVNEVIKTDYSALFQNWNDDDWQIATHYITQSRNTSTGRGKTVWIGDGTTITGISPSVYIFQVSQSGVEAKIKFEGIPTAPVAYVWGQDAAGNLYKTSTDSIALWKDTGTQLTSSKGILVSGSVEIRGDISASGDIVARSYIVQQVTSSIIFESGSSRFGNDSADRHEFTGSIHASGSIRASRLGFMGSYANGGVEVQGVWSIGHNQTTGTEYLIDTSADDFGNLYGIGYGHSNNGSAGVPHHGHNIVFVHNGTVNAGISITTGDASFTAITASRHISGGGLLYISASQKAGQYEYGVLVRDPNTGLVYHTGSYGVGGTGGGGTDDDWHRFTGDVSGSTSAPTSINQDIFTSGSVLIGHLFGSASSGDGNDALASSSYYRPALRIRGRVEQTWNNSDNQGSTIFGVGTALSMSHDAPVGGGGTPYGGDVPPPTPGIVGGERNTYFGAFIAVERQLNDNTGEYFDNTVVGYRAFQGQSTTNNNINDAGAYNVFVGSNAGRAGTAPRQNVGIGYKALTAIDSGSRDIAIGHGAGSKITNADDNVLIGSHAGDSITTGSQNIAIGTNALDDLTTGTNNIAIGYNAGVGSIREENKLWIGKEGTETTALIYGDTGEGYARINTKLGVDINPLYALDIRDQQPENDPVRIRELQIGAGQVVNIDGGGILHKSNLHIDIDGDIDVRGSMHQVPLSPGWQIISGSFRIIASGSLSSITGSTGEWTGSSVMGMISHDPAEGGSGSSFMLTGSGHRGIYFTQSAGGLGRIGIGTSNPEKDLDIHADEVRFIRTSDERGVRLNNEGNFESFAALSGESATGSELIMTYQRGTLDEPEHVQVGDVLGSIRWVVNSGSLDHRGSGEAASIQSVVSVATVAGVSSDLIFKLDISDEEGSSAPLATLKLKSNQAHQLTGSLDVTSTIKAQGIVPGTDNSSDLGTSALRWQDVYSVSTTTGGIFEVGLRTKGLKDFPTGTIVTWKDGKCVPCYKSEDQLVMGVTREGKDEPIVLGAEPVLVTGNIKEGDYIITSDVIGHGKSVNVGYIFKKNLFGKVIGQALESSKGKNSLIKCMIRKM